MMIDRKKHQELRIQFNPDGSKLRTHQLELMDLLIYFDNICKQNNIRYWLSSGTLLGAIRHEGFIPWDDDVDVEMLREDYLKFLEVFVSNDVCELQTYDNDLFYTEPFPKLRLKNSIVSEGDFDKYYKYHGAFMDIFIMEESPYLMARFCHLLMGGTRRLMFLLLPKTFLCKIILRVCKPINMFIANVCRFLCSPFVKKGVLRHTYGTGLVKNIRIASDIFPLKSIEFENHYFFVPNNSRNYLKRMFGNYMELPKHIHTHHIIKD